MAFSALLRGSISSWPHRSHRSLMSIPTRSTVQTLPPQGCCFFQLNSLIQAQIHINLSPIFQRSSTTAHTLDYQKRIGRCIAMRRTCYLPEGVGPLFPDHQSLAAIREAMESQTVLEGMAVRCDSRRDLHIRFGGWEGVIPRQEAAHPAISGAERDISVLSRVGKPTCFTITDISVDGGGKPRLLLSRRRAQEQAMAWLLENAVPGAVIPARVTHLASFGAFVDIGCGVISLIPLACLSVSRVSHPRDRLAPDQDVLAVVTAVDRDRRRFSLSQKELLGTWLENAADFAPGDTVPGVVRSVQDYGVFVELAPNLSGLAEGRTAVQPGEAVAVYIKSIRPAGHKIKLQIVQSLGPAPAPGPLRYFITDGTVENWVY